MAAPVYNSSVKVSSASNVASLTSASWTIAGSNRYLVASANSAAGTTVDPTAVRWGGSGGTAMSKQGASLTYNSAIRRMSCWTLLAPTAQSSTLYCLWPSNQDNTALMGVSATGVNQSTPTGTIASATGASQTPTVNATTVADDFVIDMVGYWSDGTTPLLTVGAGQTSRLEIEGSPFLDDAWGMSTETATGTSTTMSWSGSGAFAPQWGIYAVPLKPVAGATATPMRSLMGVGLGVRLFAASQLRESLSRRKLFKLVGALLYRK